MIAGRLSSFAVALLATVSTVAEAKCKVRHGTKAASRSTAVIEAPESSVVVLPTTTLATYVQPAIQTTKPEEVESAASQAAEEETTPAKDETHEAEATPAASKTASGSVSSETSFSEVYWGLGTRYGLSDGCTEENCWQNGACSFVDYDLPSVLDGSTCVSDDIWNNGANCGGCISVTYKQKTLKIMVTNRTGGNATHLDMTPDTWSKLTDGYTGGGVNGIKWQWIPCPLPEAAPLQVHMHKGSSKYWFAATIENATLRTKKVEVSSDGGATWEVAKLHDNNMWELDGNLPGDTAYVRVTSVEGDEVIVKDVALESGKVTKGTGNF